VTNSIKIKSPNDSPTSQTSFSFYLFQFCEKVGLSAYVGNSNLTNK
jgi:hypothetical protein